MFSGVSKSVFAFFLSVYLLTAGGHFYYQDGYHKFLAVESIAHGKGPFNEMFYTIGREGKRTTSFPPGTSLWMSPFYLVGSGLYFFLRYVDPAFYIDDPKFFTSLFVMFLNSFCVAGVCTLFFLIAVRLRYELKTAFSAALLLGLTTTLWPYSKFCFSEPQSALLLTASFYRLLCLEEKRTFRLISEAAFLFGLALITKYEVLILIPVFCGYLWYRLRRHPRMISIAGATLFLGLIGLVGSTVFLWNDWRFDAFFSFGAYEYFIRVLPKFFGFFLSAASGFGAFVWFCMRSRKAFLTIRRLLYTVVIFLFLMFFLTWLREPASAVYWHRVLLSSGKSLFVFSPLLIVSLFSFEKFFSEHKAEAIFVFCLFASYLFILKSDTIWGWGSRYYVTLIPFLCFPVLNLVRDFPRRFVSKGLAVGLIVISAAVQFLAVSVNYQDSFNQIDRWVAKEINLPIRNYEDEARFVFPKLLYHPRFSPLMGQFAVLKTIVTQRWDPAEERLLVKPGARAPRDWKIDLWWLYLLKNGLPPAVIYSIVLFLAGSALVFLIFILRFISADQSPSST